MKGVDAPIAPLIVFAVVVTVLLHPRIFCPLASRILRKLGHGSLPRLRTSTMGFLLVFYSGTWMIGGVGALAARALGRRASGVRRRSSSSAASAAVGAIVAVLAVFAPSGLGPREATMYGLLLAVTSQGAALGATVLNRVAITLVELLLLVVGGVILRHSEGRREPEPQPVEG